MYMGHLCMNTLHSPSVCTFVTCGFLYACVCVFVCVRVINVCDFVFM